MRRKAGDEALQPLRSGEGKEGHRDEWRSWRASVSTIVRIVERQEGKYCTLGDFELECPAVDTLSFCRQPESTNDYLGDNVKSPDISIDDTVMLVLTACRD